SLRRILRGAQQPADGLVVFPGLLEIERDLCRQLGRWLEPPLESGRQTVMKDHPLRRLEHPVQDLAIQRVPEFIDRYRVAGEVPASGELDELLAIGEPVAELFVGPRATLEHHLNRPRRELLAGHARAREELLLGL